MDNDQIPRATELLKTLKELLIHSDSRVQDLLEKQHVAPIAYAYMSDLLINYISAVLGGDPKILEELRRNMNIGTQYILDFMKELEKEAGKSECPQDPRSKLPGIDLARTKEESTSWYDRIIDLYLKKKEEYDKKKKKKKNEEDNKTDTPK